jgi:general L-amino acid transport system substrate-binding protein
MFAHAYKGDCMRRLMVFLVAVLVLAGCANTQTGDTTATGADTAVVTPEPVISNDLAPNPELVPTEAPTEVPTEEMVDEATPEPEPETAVEVTPEPAQAPAAPAAGGTVAQAEPAEPGETLQTIRGRGNLICGVNDQLPGFGSVDSAGNFTGFDIDFCKAIAAAVFGDPNAVQYRPLSAQERFTAVQTGEVDVLIRNTTWTISRDTTVGLDFAPTTFYDGQGMMVRTADNISSLEDMAGATICVQSGTTTEQNLADAFRRINVDFQAAVFEDNNQTAAAYDEGRCDGYTTDKSGLASTRLKLQNPDDHVILDVTMSKEPLAPSVLQGDPQWHDIVSWVVFATFTAEELGITSENLDTFNNSEDPTIRRLLGMEGDLGTGLGLENDFVVDVIRAVGNYGEIYNRHLGPDTAVNIPRGLNAQYMDGGLIYAPPFR